MFKTFSLLVVLPIRRVCKWFNHHKQQPSESNSSATVVRDTNTTYNITLLFPFIIYKCCDLLPLVHDKRLLVALLGVSLELGVDLACGGVLLCVGCGGCGG
jgi:hypothetical protein